MSQEQQEQSLRKAKKLERDASRRKDKSKKRKRDDVEDSISTGQAVVDGRAEVLSSAENASNDAEKTAPSNGSKTAKHGRPKKRTKTQSTDGVDAKSRFIVFVGNLPYAATDASLRLHFKSLEPFTLRHRIDPQTKRSKGFAFLEFENFDRMKTCLKLYHHSMFDAEAREPSRGKDEAESTGVDNATNKKRNKNARRINVELTAGGGGRNENRKEKIKAKNVRLEEQRRRRAELEAKERAKKDAKKKAGAETDEKTAVAETAKPSGIESASNALPDVHPSRLAQVSLR